MALVQDVKQDIVQTKINKYDIRCQRFSFNRIIPNVLENLFVPGSFFNPWRNTDLP
jgi:hypothetical protein